ncbi:hypothetical protein [Leifsonia sp. 109]|uniref:hypothetical protein n=1 Tax=Leifsonia sp. 109 TaxID=1150399 RepID=UPI0010DB0A18|nr:hypothetical protein [Leifsonia sp. 109]TDP99831.1 hypothetical protein AXZ95_3761 [Leifsonia sp. 115AMFTsu3.1]
MRWRTVLGWVPATLCIVLVAAGIWLDAARTGIPGVLLVGTLDSGQLSVLLVAIGAACGVVAAIQAAVLAGRLRRPFLRVLVRAVSGLLLLAALPVGYLLMLLAAFSSVHAYEPIAAPGHNVVVRSFTWHHRSLDLLEQDGLLFHEVAICGEGIPVDGYDAFAAGQYDLVSRGDRDVIRFAERPGGPFTGEAILGSRPGDDVTASCSSR